MSDVFGRRLRAFRKLKRLTQAQLADQLGVGISMVGTLERGTRVPSQQMIEHLSAVLDVSERELLGDLTLEEIRRTDPWT